MTQVFKQLNVESWSVDNVVEWLKGIRSFAESFVKNFEAKQINGRKLSLLEMSDLHELVGADLSHQIIIYKSIQNLLQMKYDLNRDTLHGLIFNTYNRLNSIHRHIERIIQNKCSIRSYNSDTCIRLKHDLISSTSTLAVSYRKLMTWLVRLPFTKLLAFEKFRDEINNQMKLYLKSFRKKINENSFDELKETTIDLLEYLKSTLDFCDLNCDKENGKIAVVFNYCYLEKVVLRRRTPTQELGLSLICLNDGVFTIAEIVRESAADECARLNVEDDIIAVNNQIVIGWDIYSINKLLNDSFNTNAVYIVLRKMPREHSQSIRQQQQNNRIYNVNDLNQNKKQNNANRSAQQHQRKHSFSDIFLTDEYILDNTSDDDDDEDEDDDQDADEEDEYVDINNNNLANQVNLNDQYVNTLSKRFKVFGRLVKKLSNENLSDKNRSESPASGNKSPASSVKNKTNSNAKITKKGSKNRLIKSMQNLIFYDRSRSNSNDNLSMGKKNSSNKSPCENINELKKEEESSRSESVERASDKLKSLFMKKNWDLNTKKSFDSEQNGDMPSLVNVKKIDSIKRNDSGEQTERSKLNSLSDDNYNNSQKTVSSKPPLGKRAQRSPNQKPTIQGWLFKRKQPKLTSSTSNLSRSTTNSSGSNITSNNNGINNTLLRNGKWKRYWCVLMKDIILFYKQQNDSTPKDFILLKDFNVLTSGHKNGFILFDKLKQLEHEFYAESFEDYREWHQVLFELRIKLGREQMISSSTTSLSSSYDTNSNIPSTTTNSYSSSLNNDDISISSQSLPSSSTLSRKNNLNLQLSTIIDSDDYSSMINSTNTVSSSPAVSNNVSPTLISSFQNQHFNGSSRESSPCISNANSKLASRDSSPSLAYPYMQDQDNGVGTSESDAELCTPDGKNKIKEIISNKKGIKKHNSNLSIVALAAAANAGIVSKQASCSPSPASTSSGYQFVYDDVENNNEKDKLPHGSQIRCNSLPGSLQSCVGSFMQACESKRQLARQNAAERAERERNLANQQNQSQAQSPQPQSPLSRPQSQPVQSQQETILQQMHQQKISQLRSTSSSLSTPPGSPSPTPSPSAVSKNTQSLEKSNPIIYQTVNYANSTPSSPLIKQRSSILSNDKQGYNHLPQKPPMNSSPQTRRISVQVGPNGITQINTFNFNTSQPIDSHSQQVSLSTNSLSNQNLQAHSQPQKLIVTKISKLNTNTSNSNINNVSNNYWKPAYIPSSLNPSQNLPPPSPPSQSSSPVVYRTELTIMPSSFKNATSSQTSNPTTSSMPLQVNNTASTSSTTFTNSNGNNPNNARYPSNDPKRPYMF